MENFSGMVNKNGFEVEPCERCGGVGKVLTKRGKAARQWMIARQQTPVEALQVGYKVWVTPNPLAHEKWWTVTEIGEGFFKTAGCSHHGRVMLRATPSNERNKEQIAEALVYQETLDGDGVLTER